MSDKHEVIGIVRRGVSYADAVQWQKDLARAMAENPAEPGAVLFVEHKPVITCGRSGDGGNLLASPEQLREAGIEYHLAGRGGDVTYHGPGQWTVYPILRLEWYKRDLHRYLRLLEECVIHFLAKYGVGGGRRNDYTGVWVDTAKVAAIGIAVTRWITWHGFALNISTDVENFTRFMHPCGIRSDIGSVTSLDLLTHTPHDLQEVLPALRQSIEEILDLTFLPHPSDSEDS